jgi:phospholipid/cholesterol/gamma-HCH transport system substrate-binding protein
MKRAIQKHVWDFVAVVGLAVLALLVAAFVLSHQRFYLPSWVPAIGSDFVDYNAEFSTAQAVMPGQGQTIQVAGVSIGEIGTVKLRDGKAIVQMKIKKRYTPIYRDATALLRPKTGLQDMVIALDPGNPSAGTIPEGGSLPIAQTEPAVNFDEFLAGLDADTQDYLKLLVGGAGEGLNGNAEELAATLKRFDPTARYLRRINRLLAKRDKAIARSIHNFRLFNEALGDSDAQLARFVDSSNKVFEDFASEQASLRETLRLLPNALRQTQTALSSSAEVSSIAGPTLTELMPSARGLAPALKGFQRFARATTPTFEDELRPFVPVAEPTVKALRPAANDLAESLPGLTDTLDVLNSLFNGIAYNPPGKEEGYLYWLGWANHLGAAIFSTGDAHGPLRRGQLYSSCASLRVFQVIGKANPALGMLSELLNAPTPETACAGQGAQTASAKAAANGAGNASAAAEKDKVAPAEKDDVPAEKDDVAPAAKDEVPAAEKDNVAAADTNAEDAG